MTAPIDYNAVLSDLEAKRGQIDAAIAVIRSLIGGGSTEGAPQSNGVPSGDDSTAPTGTVPGAPAQSRPVATGLSDPNIFFRLSTPAAIKKYLNMVKRPQTARVIADALHNGGQVHAADEKTAYVNVATALRRNEDFVQTRNKEWGLAEWYGNKPKGDGE
jgi:hypothetical protein